MTMAPQESGSSSIGMKRAVQESGSSTAVQEIVKKSKTEEIEEYFVCNQCFHRIARGRDLLGRREAAEMTGGFFRNVFNVDREHAADPGTGNYFTAKVLCSECGCGLGRIFVRVCPFIQSPLFVAGNYIIMMHMLFIESGMLLLNAITREVVYGHTDD